MDYPPVRTKHDFVKRYKAGEFGNASKTWNDILSFLRSDEAASRHGTFHLRNRVKGGPTWYNVPCNEVASTWERVCATRQADPDDLYISAMAPTPLTLIQGELMQHVDGVWQFHFSREKLPMREALVKSSTTLFNGPALWTARAYMNQRSKEWLDVLLERYPGHVIEFSVYSLCWGTIPGYNTVFWEVRNY